MKCLNCNTETDNPKFCDSSCAATFNNRVHPKRIAKKGKCRWCDAEIYSPKKYCNQICQWNYLFETSIKPRVEAGRVTSVSTLKNYLTRARGYICTECDNKGIHNNKLLKLQMDHIDGNSDNNLPRNLRFLCPNCHSQTETFTTRQKKDTKRNRYLRKIKGY